MSRLILSATVAVSLIAGSARAQDAPAAVEIIRTTDAQMTCTQISDEAAQLSAAMGSEPRGGVFGRLGGVARAGAAMLIPGAGLAMAAADAATAGDRAKREAEALAGQNRWYYLNGLYAGQKCDAPARAEVASDPAVTAQPASPVVPAQPTASMTSAN